MLDGRVETESRRSRVDKEGDEECKEKDCGDGDNHVTRRLLRFQALVGEWN